jgi:chromosome segregation ATPase
MAAPLAALCRLAVVVLATGGLAACANCTRDPSQAGLGCGVVNLASGVYADDEAALRAELAAAEERATMLRLEADRLAAQQASLDGERRQLAARMERLNGELATSIQELDRLSGAQSVDRQRLAELRAREAALSERQLGVSRAGDVTPAELQALEAQNARLREEIEALLGAL